MEIMKIRIKHTSIVLDLRAGLIVLLTNLEQLAVFDTSDVNIIRLTMCKCAPHGILFTQKVNHHWLSREYERCFRELLAKKIRI